MGAFQGGEKVNRGSTQLDLMCSTLGLKMEIPRAERQESRVRSVDLGPGKRRHGRPTAQH